jgi:hypothetical protein
MNNSTPAGGENPEEIDFYELALDLKTEFEESAGFEFSFGRRGPDGWANQQPGIWAFRFTSSLRGNGETTPDMAERGFFPRAALGLGPWTLGLGAGTSDLGVRRFITQNTQANCKTTKGLGHVLIKRLAD